MQMQMEGKNMEDVRRELGVRSLRWKIEKRILERIGHVMRMGDERMTKAVVLGWLGELEKWPKQDEDKSRRNKFARRKRRRGSQRAPKNRRMSEILRNVLKSWITIKEYRHEAPREQLRTGGHQRSSTERVEVLNHDKRKSTKKTKNGTSPAQKDC